MMTMTIRRPYQTAFEVQTNCENLMHLLRLQYGQYLRENRENDCFRISVRKHNTSYQICFAGKTTETDFPLEWIDNILIENTHYHENILALHGAAVEWSGKAYLFLASTTGGKTTLASYLTRNGFGYITDDCILLSRQTFQVYPYHTPLHLRDGGVEVLKRLNALPKHLEILQDGLAKRYVYTPPNCIDKPLPLGTIFFINRTDEENGLIQLDTTSRMVNLLRSPITVYTPTPEYLQLISSLSKAKCFELRYCDMSFVSEAIKQGRTRS